VNETLEYTVPMLKLGRRNFPMQESVYENIKFIMTNQIKLYNALNNAETVIISLKLGINISEETYLEMCNLITHYKNVQLGIHEANDDGVELPYISTATVDVHYKYNPKFGAIKNVNVVMIIIVILMGMIIMKLWVVSIVVVIILK
jgi:hypothetical protein